MVFGVLMGPEKSVFSLIQDDYEESCVQLGKVTIIGSYPVIVECLLKSQRRRIGITYSDCQIIRIL